jgi:hypothetical protein
MKSCNNKVINISSGNTLEVFKERSHVFQLGDFKMDNKRNPYATWEFYSKEDFDMFKAWWDSRILKSSDSARKISMKIHT